MSGERVERRLAAILAADVAGYSRLIGRDEAGTLARLRAHRQELIDPKIVEHKGRIVKTTGDGILIEFPSVVEAVACAVAVQRGMGERNARTAEEQRIVFRVGVNLGDVIVEADDIHGDGVNVAARLESVAAPGGISVSAIVHDQVRDRLDLTFDDMGEQSLKNIARPLRVYQVRLDAAITPNITQTETGPMLALPGKPSIAVLPFANMSGDAEQEYFADGMAEEITTALSRVRSFFVIARNSSFTYKGRAVDVREVGRELGVGYVVEGSVRREGNRIRITAQLIDAETGNHIWAERYDRDLADIFAVQDEITRAMVTALAPAISQAEQQRALQSPPDSLSAWEAYQRALSQWPKFDDLSSTREFLQRAVALDPHFASAHAMLATRHLGEISLGARSLADGMRLAESSARTALELDPDSAVAHAVLAWVFSFQGDRGPALEEAEAAITLNPNEPYGHLVKGGILVFSGQPGEAREHLATALRLDPRGITALPVMSHRVIGSYFEGDYLAAEAMARRVIRAYPQVPRSYPWLAAALGQQGRLEEAATALNAAITVSPSYFEFVTRSRPLHFHRLADHEHLRKAGWQG